MRNPGNAEPQLGSKVPAAELAIPGSAEPQLGSNVPAAELAIPGSAEPQLGSNVPAAELGLGVPREHPDTVQLPGSDEPQLGSNVPAAELGLGVPRGVPKGYKRTEVGVIPEEWGESPVANVISSFQNGFAFASHGYVKSGIPIVTMAQIGLDGVFYFKQKNVNYWPSDAALALASFQLFQGDIIIAMTDVTPQKNLIGRMAEVTETGPLLLNQRVGLLRLDLEKIDPYFLRAISNSARWRDYTKAVASLGVQANISTKDILAGKIPHPPLPEQRAIAEALGDVDALLGALDAAIAKQRDLKQAAMQQLLTGQTRLPGFQGEWEVKRFGELTVPRKDRVDPSQPDVKGLCIELEHIESGAGRLLGCAEIRQGSSLKSCFYAGDILFGKLRAYLKKFWLADREGFCSTEIWVFATDSNKMAAGFLSQIVRTADFVDAASLSYGTHMPRSDWKVLQNFEVRVPCIDEQQAIATILSDIDTALTTLESRRTKTAAIKQAMMQELLTGRIRLPGAPGPSPARVTLGTPSPSSARVDSRAELGLGAPRDGAPRDGASRDGASGTRLV